MRYQFIQEYVGHFPLSALCWAMRVSRSGYAAWQGRRVSRRSQQEQELLIRIREAHQRSGGTYGSPRIHQEMHHGGPVCSLNRTARIMQKHQITAWSLRRFAVTTDSAHSLPVAPNRLGQDFRVDRPDTA